MNCRACEQDIQASDEFCQFCGTPMTTELVNTVTANPASVAKPANGFSMAGDLGGSSYTGRVVPQEKSSVKPSGFDSHFKFANDIPSGSAGAIPSGGIKQPSGYDPTVIEVPETVRTDIVQFKRSPRIMHEIPGGIVEISSPPAAGTRPEINWLSTFLPTIISIAIAIIMTTVFGNVLMMLYTLPMTLGGVVISITNYLRQAKKYNEQLEVRQQKYDAHIRSVVAEIEEKRDSQFAAMLLSDPETSACLEIVRRRQPRLWERSPEDPDFLSARIGQGPVDLAVRIIIPKEGLSLEEDALIAKPREIQKKYSVIDNAPIRCNFFKEQICGIVGSRSDTKALVKNLIVQLATHHSYTEMRTVCIYNPSDEVDLRWIKDLPHFQDDARKTSFVATSKSKAKELFRHFTDVFRQRKNASLENSNYGKSPLYLPYYLFIILEPSFLEKNDPINEYLFMRRNLGIGCIMVVQDVSQLPKECHELIELKGSNGQLFNTEHASEKQPFILDYFSESNYVAFGQSMKPLCCEEGILGDTLPQSYSFYEMMGISSIIEFDIKNNWRTSNVSKTLAAPIGISESGKAVYLDLHERGHGPHGLVAGMTGSGKSELLQSYILSMALHYHPYEVSFVIIDFKGGGMANQVAGLPHLIGPITNIDGQELQRSLMSIEAELHRRQRIIKEFNDSHTDKVKDIYDYIDRYKANAASYPLPHLIVIVDEFAELKAEQPEFMKKLISAARIGRSLGVHLILSTQKPAGQVDDQIWSNSNFQMCLKVASSADSKEVIKSDLASQIVEPGRAYLRVGNNSIFELFQSGYSGEKITVLGGKTATQMQETIGYVRQYCQANGIEKLHDICLEPLSNMIEYPQEAKDTEGTLVSVGFYDDPKNQYQGEFAVDPFSKNTLIIGTARTGKTNILQTIIRAVANKYGPDEVNIYIIDFASMLLKAFEPLNHVGGVIIPSEDEKFKNLIKLLYSEIEIRKEKFYTLGVGSYAAYRDAGETDLPRIVLIIDNFTALRELYLVDNDPIQSICQNGITYGISVIMANSQTTGISYQYLSNFSTRIALYCNNSTEYNVLFEKCPLQLRDIPGRSIVEKNASFYHCQMYKSFAGKKEAEQAKAIKAFVNEKIEKYDTCKAKPIPEIPSILYPGHFRSMGNLAPEDSLSIAVGLDYETVMPFFVDFRNIGVMAASGRRHFGRRNFLRYLIYESERQYPGRTEFYIVDGIDCKMHNIAGNSNVKEYVFLPDQAIQLIKNIEAMVIARYEAVINSDINILRSSPVIVLMINNTDAIEAICNNDTTLTAYNNITGKYKNMNVCVILGAVENATISYNAPEILKNIREGRKLFLFDDIGNLKMFDLPYSSTKHYKKALQIGD